eukprot:TRINITY_DN65852_c0_g1_i1.p1 TRINITY_DN65852_c0_g1~~TRINITY_DN65852_c0_g1_i1.p1  ORF type:complete len:368 (+),score=42.65 TRINITY_DN65852_c0_g1_i1:267-1370(+)
MPGLAQLARTLASTLGRHGGSICYEELEAPKKQENCVFVRTFSDRALNLIELRKKQIKEILASTVTSTTVSDLSIAGKKKTPVSSRPQSKVRFRVLNNKLTRSEAGSSESWTAANNPEHLLFENDFVVGSFALSTGPHEFHQHLDGTVLEEDALTAMHLKLQLKEAINSAPEDPKLRTYSFPPPEKWFTAGEIDGKLSGIDGGFGAQRLLAHVIVSVMQLLDTSNSLQYQFGGESKSERSIAARANDDQIQKTVRVTNAFMSTNSLSQWASAQSESAISGSCEAERTTTLELGLKLNFLDFENWRVVNVPKVNNFSLKRFWGNRPVRIVIGFETIDSRTGETDVSVGTDLQSNWVRVLEIEIAHETD